MGKLTLKRALLLLGGINSLLLFIASALLMLQGYHRIGVEPGTGGLLYFYSSMCSAIYVGMAIYLLLEKHLVGSSRDSKKSYSYIPDK